MPNKPTYEELEQKVKELDEKINKQELNAIKHRKAEDIYRQLVENIREVLIINSTDKKKTIYVSPAYEKIWGMSPASLYENPTSFLDAIHPQDRKRVIETFNQQKEGNSIEVEYRLLRADKSVIWVSAQAWIAFSVLENSLLSFVAIREITRRKQLEEKLKQANDNLEQQVANGIEKIKQYKHIVETMDSPVGMVDRNFIYRYVNEPYSRALNKPTFEIIGHSVPELFGQTFFKTAMENHYTRCFSGETVEFQEWFDLPGWGRRYMDVSYSPFRDSNGDVIASIVSAHDITKLKNTIQFEQKLSDLSSKFINLSSENIDSNIIDAFEWLGPFMKADRSHMFGFNWNRTEFSITHLWEAESIKKDQIIFPGFIVKDSFPWLFECLVNGKDVIVPDVEVLSTPETMSEYLYCQEIGIQSFVILPIEMEGGALFAIGLDTIHHKKQWTKGELDRLRMTGQVIANTISHRHAAKESEEAAIKYQTVADYTYDWEYWENSDGTLQYVSPSCKRICGYTHSELMDNPSLLQDLILPKDKKILNEHHCCIQEKKKPAIQFRIQRPDGEIRWIEHVCQAVSDSLGNYQGIRGSNRDVTDRELYKSEANQLRLELAHMDRIVTINALTSALAHEINQPLAAIRSYAQAALRFMDMDPPEYLTVKEALLGIVGDNKRASRVINRLRDLVKKGKTSQELIEMNSVIKDVLDLLNSEIILRKASVILDLHPDLPMVMVDPIQIQQVLINLLTNALDGMNHQTKGLSTIVISTKPDPHKGVLVSISDSGIGIPEDKKQLLFEPFHTTKPKGIGLGLGICKTIIDSHEGEIWCDNNKEGGAIFYFTLPAENRSN